MKSSSMLSVAHCYLISCFYLGYPQSLVALNIKIKGSILLQQALGPFCSGSVSLGPSLPRSSITLLAGRGLLFFHDHTRFEQACDLCVFLNVTPETMADNLTTAMVCNGCHYTQNAASIHSDPLYIQGIRYLMFISCGLLPMSYFVGLLFTFKVVPLLLFLMTRLILIFLLKITRPMEKEKKAMAVQLGRSRSVSSC